MPSTAAQQDLILVRTETPQSDCKNVTAELKPQQNSEKNFFENRRILEFSRKGLYVEICTVRMNWRTVSNP